MIKHLKPGWGTGLTLLFIAGVAVISGFRGDWIGVGIDLAAIVLLLPLASAKRRQDARTRAAILGQPTMSELPPPPDWLIKGYEPVETPEHGESTRYDRPRDDLT